MGVRNPLGTSGLSRFLFRYFFDYGYEGLDAVLTEKHYNRRVTLCQGPDAWKWKRFSTEVAEGHRVR